MSTPDTAPATSNVPRFAVKTRNTATRRAGTRRVYASDALTAAMKVRIAVNSTTFIESVHALDLDESGREIVAGPNLLLAR